jgi:transcriptional regulator with XRE-family HTH domain
MFTLLLLTELLHRSGEKPASLAKRLSDQGVRQPQLSRYLSGKTKEPKLSTLAPIAEYYGVSAQAFFDEALASQLLQQIKSGEFVVQRNLRRRNTSGTNTPESSRPAVGVAGIEQAVEALATRINEMDDPQLREQIALQLQTLARAPDSLKARQGLLDALGAHGSQPVNALPPAQPIGGTAGAVLAKKLTTESREVFKRDRKTDA